MEEETKDSPVEDDINRVLSVGSTSRGFQTTYLIISLVLSVGCGLLLMVLVWKKEYLQRPSNYLRCNLAVDDIIFTGSLIPVRINALFRQDPSGGQLWCSAEGLVAPICVMSMYGTYLMMAVDLYYFVCDPLHYHDKVTTKRVVLGIVAVRAFSLFFGIAFVALFGLPQYSWRCEMVMEPANSAFAIFISGMIIFFFSIVVLSVPMIYCRVIKEAKRQQERDENRDLWVFQTKAFRVMAPHAIVWTVSITTTSFYAAMLLALINDEQVPHHALIIAERVTVLLYLTVSSMANPTIHSFRLQEIRRACRELCGWPTNPNPPVVPARRHRQDDMELAAMTGHGHGAPAVELAPAQTSAEGLIMQPTADAVPSAITGPGHGAPAMELAPAQTSAEGLINQPTADTVPSDQEQKQTTQADMIPGLAPRTGHRGRETAPGRPFRLTVCAEVHAEPTPRPSEGDMTAALPGQVHTDAEAADIPTLTLDT